MRSWSLAILALAAVAACGSSGLDEVVAPPTPFESRLAENDALAAAVDALPLATVSEVPASGSATYDGFASILIETPLADSALIGDATIVADFGGDDLTGTIDAFEGSVNGGAVRGYDGFLTVGDGDLRVAGPSGFGANAGGVLTGGGDVIGIDGSIFGSFRSAPGRDASALRAVAASGTSYSVNGIAREGSMTIVADR